MVNRLLYLNGMATLGVVLYHATAWGFIALFWWTDRYRLTSVPDFSQLGGLSYYGLRAIEQLIIFTIPAFLFVSGFFVAIATGKYQETVSWNLILKRIRRLVIPFLIWSLIIIAARMLQGRQYAPLDLLEVILTGKAEPPYYYVPVLVQLYLLAPFIVPLARVRWRPVLALAGLVQLVAVGLRYTSILNIPFPGSRVLLSLTQNWLFPAYLFFFVFGIVAGFHLPELKRWLERWQVVFPLALLVFFGLGMVEWEALLRASGQTWIAPQETVIDNLYAVACLLTFFACIRFRLPLAERISGLGGRSFGVYLIHSPALEYGARVIYHIAPFILPFQMVFQPVLWLIGLLTPLALMAIVNRSPVRRFYSALFG